MRRGEEKDNVIVRYLPSYCGKVHTRGLRYLMMLLLLHMHDAFMGPVLLHKDGSLCIITTIDPAISRCNEIRLHSIQVAYSFVMNDRQ